MRLPADYFGLGRQGWAGSCMFPVVEGFSLGRLVKAECVYMSEGAFPSALRAMRQLHQVSRDIMDEVFDYSV